MPKGIDVLYLRFGARFRLLLHWRHEDCGGRVGTENTASIVGFGKDLQEESALRPIL